MADSLPSSRPTSREQWQAVLLAAVCAVLFLRDGLLPGRALVPFPPEVLDVRAAEAIARGTFDPQDALRGNVSMGDKYQQSLCWDRVLQDRLRDLDVPLWTNDIGGGASFVPQMAQVYEPINLLLFVLPSEQWYGWWYFVHLVLFGWLCYRFVRRLGCAHASALLAVVCATLGMWTQCKLHHNVVLTAALPLWPMLSAAHAIATGHGRGPGASPVGRAVGWLALWTGISWLSGFAVVSLQASYLAVGFALLLCLRNAPGQRLRPLLWIGCGMALGGLLSLPHMVPVLLASAASARDAAFDPATLAANGLEWDHALALLWPDLLTWGDNLRYLSPADAPGGPFAEPSRMPWSQLVLLSEPLFRGRAIHSWVETQFAIGVPALACALLALPALRDRGRRAVVGFFLAVAVLGFWLATADQPMLSLARLLPGLSAADLRRTLFCVAMALVVLAALGADRVLRQPRPWLAIGFLGAVATVSLVAWLWLLGQRPEPDFVRSTAELLAMDGDHPQVAGRPADAIAQWIAAVSKRAPDGSNLEAQHNLAALSATALRALLVALLAGLALLLPWPRARCWVLGAATAAELLHAGLGPVQTVPASRVQTPPAVLQPVVDAEAEAPGGRPRLQRLGAAAEARAAALYLPNLPAYHGVEDAAAYNPLPPRRMEEFFLAIEPDRAGKTSVATGGAGVVAFHDPATLRHPLCDLFGVRYVLTDQAVPTAPGLHDVTPQHTGRFRLLERTTTLPRATFVRDVEVLVDREARLRRLGAADRDVAHTVILERADAIVPAAAPAAPPAAVEIVARGDERVVVRVANAADGYLRLADPYDPGWTVTVDGQRRELLVADHYLRAVYLEPGEHEVVFAFDAARVVWPPRLGLLALLAVLALLLRCRRNAALP